MTTIMPPDPNIGVFYLRFTGYDEEKRVPKIELYDERAAREALGTRKHYKNLFRGEFRIKEGEIVELKRTRKYREWL